MGTFEAFDHTADVGLEVRGESLEDLLATAAQAVFSVIIEAGPSAVETETEVLAEAETGARAEWEDVFVAWLQELLYRFETQRLVPLRFEFAEAAPAPASASGGSTRSATGPRPRSRPSRTTNWRSAKGPTGRGWPASSSTCESLAVAGTATLVPSFARWVSVPTAQNRKTRGGCGDPPRKVAL